MKFIYAYSIKAQQVDDTGTAPWSREIMGTVEASDELEAIGKATKRAREVLPRHRNFCNWTVNVLAIPRNEVEYAAYHYYGMRHPEEQEIEEGSFT